MTDKQLGILYTIVLTMLVAMTLGFSHLLDGGPMSAEEYADKLCQEIYGSQTGAVWIDASLRCETARGEIIEVRKP